MDDKGFVFTGDAVLALIIFFIFSASILTYYTMPAYMGSDHEQLETLAADTLAVMQTDGSLISAAALSTTDPAKAEAELRDRLNSIIPPGTSYRLTVGGSFVVENNSGGLANKDTATRVVVISNPGQGWVGRAWYKVESVEFQNVTINSTTTAWNFHNYLTNFDPWSNGLASYPLWGSASATPNTPINIQFSIPPNSQIYGGYFLIGSNNKRGVTNISQAPAFGANVTINGITQRINSSNFTYVYSRNTNWPMYNYKGTIPAGTLNTGFNQFYVRFINASNYVSSTNQGHGMPYFSLLASYASNITIPEGIITQVYNFSDVAGIGSTSLSQTFNLQTGAVTNYSARSLTWSNMLLQNHSYQDGIPFALSGVPINQYPTNPNNNPTRGSAVCTVQDIYIPPEGKVLDAYTVVNAYGGVDNALVEVWNGERWSVVFCSFDFNATNTTQEFSARNDGYGNTPGIVYINSSYFQAGTTNKVRVTVWDQVANTGNDYDLVGLVDSYTVVSYTSLPIRWENFPFISFQNSTNFTQSIQNFQITEGAQKAYMFFGVGLDSRQVSVEIKNTSSSTWKLLYNNTSIPFSLDLASLDAANSNGTNGVIAIGNGNNYTLKNGSFQVRLTVWSSPSWQSGDGSFSPPAYSNAEIYSGTRIAIIYPKFLSNLWSTSYSSDPMIAQINARNNLSAFLNESFGRGIDPSPIKTEAIFTGDLPASIPVRLELWRN